MNKYLIRFNQTRGQPGRGTADHAWRVFENGKEFLFKHLEINVQCTDEVSDEGKNWNICCYGYLKIDRESSTAVINKTAD